jgi:hypothetical protein
VCRQCRPNLQTDLGEDDTDAGVRAPSERSIRRSAPATAIPQQHRREPWTAAPRTRERENGMRPKLPFGMIFFGQLLHPVSEFRDAIGTNACCAVTRWRSTLWVWGARYMEVWLFVGAAAWSPGREPGFTRQGIFAAPGAVRTGG